MVGAVSNRSGQPGGQGNANELRYKVVPCLAQTCLEFFPMGWGGQSSGGICKTCTTVFQEGVQPDPHGTSGAMLEKKKWDIRRTLQ